MFDYIKNAWSRVRTWYPLSQVPAGFFSGWFGAAPQGRLSEVYFGQDYANQKRGITLPNQALALPPVWACLRLYQGAASALPLVSYQKLPDDGRERIEDASLFNLLHERPNAAQSLAVFMERNIWDYWLEGECFIQLRWANNNRLMGLYPIPARNVIKIDLDDEWKKTYHVIGFDDPLMDEDVCHIINTSDDWGLRGISFLRWAAESLGLHKQILDTAHSIYRNSARISAQITQSVERKGEAKKVLDEEFNEQFAGAINAGKIPRMPYGEKIEPVDTRTAEAIDIINALNLSTASIAQWFSLSPLVVGDLSRGTYSNSAADKLAFHQKNMLPLLRKFELELNHKIFGSGSDQYCEFLTDNILRADPLVQSQVWHNGITDGYLLKSECRAWLNLPSVPGLDQPTQPANMVPVEAGLEGEQQQPNTTAEVQPVENPEDAKAAKQQEYL